MHSIYTNPGTNEGDLVTLRGEVYTSTTSKQRHQQHLSASSRENVSKGIPVRSFSGSSSNSGVDSVLSSSDTSSGAESTSSSSLSMATEVCGEACESSRSAIENERDEEDDGKSSGHTIVTKKSNEQHAHQQAEHSDLTRPSPNTRTSSSSADAIEASLHKVSTAPSSPSLSPAVRYSRLPGPSIQRTKPTRQYSTTGAAASSSSSATSTPTAARNISPRSQPAGPPAASSSARALSTSPRHSLSRSYTTSAVSSMAMAGDTAVHHIHGSSSPPHQFPGTSSVAPPVQNSASVTFAPAPTRTRAYSTSASGASGGLTSPTSPAVATMASISAEVYKRSPPAQISPSASPPSAPLASHQALINATSSSISPQPGSNQRQAAATTSSSANIIAVGSGATNMSTSDATPLSPFSNSSPPYQSSATNRRHTLNNNNNSSSNNSTSSPAANSLQFQPATGHRRLHQSISVPPSEYSSLGSQQNQHRLHQSNHLQHLNSRYRKTSLGSQTVLSADSADLMTTSASSSLNPGISVGSSLDRRSEWDTDHLPPHRPRHHGHDYNSSPGDPQMSPTRSRNEPYMSASPRYSSRGSHDNQRNNQLEAKIVLLGRQGVGKTSLVHRYITGQFSSSLPMTIGASFLVKKLDFEGGIKVRLQIWDTAGQERFRSMAPMYYRGAHAAILVYDITNDESLNDIQVWLDELRRNMSSELIVHIVGNKADLADTSRKITLEHAQKQIAQWIAEPVHNTDGSSLNAPPGRRTTSGGHTTPGRSADEGLLPPPPAPVQSSGRQGMVSLGSFGLSRSGSRQKTPEEVEPALPAFKDWGLEEVSAKEDEGIDMLFATIAGKLVERKTQIEQERELRKKHSIMISDEAKGQAGDPTQVWGCC